MNENKHTVDCPRCSWGCDRIYPDAAAQSLVKHLYRAHRESMAVEDAMKLVQPIEHSKSAAEILGMIGIELPAMELRAQCGVCTARADGIDEAQLVPWVQKHYQTQHGSTISAQCARSFIKPKGNATP